MCTLLISRKAAATQQITSGTLLPGTRSNAAGKQERGHARCPSSENCLIDQVGIRTQHCLSLAVIVRRHVLLLMHPRWICPINSCTAQVRAGDSRQKAAVSFTCVFTSHAQTDAPLSGVTSDNSPSKIYGTPANKIAISPVPDPSSNLGRSPNLHTSFRSSSQSSELALGKQLSCVWC